MSEEQQTEAAQTGDAWDDPISEERKAELKALADQQCEWVKKPELERGDSHFKSVKLTGADVHWLVGACARSLS
jgi:hypothetical protein